MIGDRNTPADLAPLASYEYDVCIDTCAYFPEQIKLLADSVKTRHYSLISSVYVYADQDALLREDALLVPGDDTSANELTPDSYGALKMLCEKAALAHFGHSRAYPQAVHHYRYWRSHRTHLVLVASCCDTWQTN